MEKIIRVNNLIFGGERGLYWRLSAEENMKYFGDLYRIPDEELKQRIPYLIDIVGLSGREKEKVENFSKGMKQRLQIARSLINKPEVLFLDEPTIGLDPVGARELRSIILKLKSIGTTVILTTHYIYEADELCDRIALINKGEVIDVDTSRNLKIKYIGNGELFGLYNY
ncbi:MAG: ABC transporter ATP-binding protein [Inconstantimicrobium porci]|uniref:ABC transporter ATP-binding protein n=1 Tax=Inconstantimicrobium porci TaxID=2652291 RepID=UPI002A9097F7|nr:ABC transporter ATP-binding protein [Inconstantimicrobium porci]MDY5910570.1 ABC transporter ATP-binding protein [Inconstantimicrobium porci]